MITRSYPRYIATAHDTGWGVVDRWAEETLESAIQDGSPAPDRQWVTVGDWSRELAEKLARDMSQAAGSRGQAVRS